MSTIMSSKDPKSKKGKDGEKRSAKKSEDSILEDEKKEESFMLESETPASEVIIEQPPPKEPSPEPVYDEPTLSDLIIESYEGEKVRGMYDGEGYATYTGDHTYKGQFCSGLMHGKGLYTWSDGVQYDGDFCQNKVTGKGIYRWTDGSMYEGEVLDGKRHGMGTFRAKGNKVSYTGEWSMGKRHGKGRMDYDNEGRSFYDGDWINNVKHGWGMRQYPSGNVYQGMWFNNVRHGDGTMKWLDRNQVYSGQWENGIQHGMGHHIWLLKRVVGSQYPLRNMYDGEFINGLRHGYGSFFYANGAKYEGGWKNNMKHGKGKFTFKNGRIYEGMFERDHIVEYPDFTMDGTTTPDITQIRTRTPLPNDNVSIHSNESKNTVSPSFQLEIDNLLNQFTEVDREEEASQVLFVITRYISSLRKIYTFYSALGYEESTDNTFVMNKMQFWRFMMDCRFHHLESTLMDMDRSLGYGKEPFELHNPYERILQRDFVNNLIILAYHIYHDQHEGTTPILAWCLSKLITENILRHSCNVQGHFYYETRRAVNALVHLDQSYEVFNGLCTQRKNKPNEPALKMRQFLYMMKDLRLINSDLTPKEIIQVLSSDDPNVADGEGCCNMELEMTFLEFFEALIGCAEVYVTEAVVKDPTTPRPSTVLTPEQSMYSMPGSPSRLASQVGEEGAESQAQGSPRQGSPSPETASPTRGASSAEGTTKTGEPVSSRVPADAHQTTSHATQGSENGAASRHESAKDVADQHKSASFVSNRTGVTDDNNELMKSTVSIGAQTGPQSDGEEGDEKQGLEGNDQDEEEEELDEATRQFNFWTHQIHIFFVRKFFPAAEKLAHLKQVVDKKRTEEVKQKIKTETQAIEDKQVAEKQ